MARKRQQNIVRTDYLENWIGFFRANGHSFSADAYCKIARDIGAPIEAEEVDRWEKVHTSSQLELFERA